MTTQHKTYTKQLVWQRLHSLLGLWIVIFLIEHLLTNSQSALLFGENGMGFIRAVNLIKNLPYLPFIELFLIGVPIVFHGILGIRILMSAKMNSFPGKHTRPTLTKYSRNLAYSFQRITAWILVFGIIAHVGFMRFYMHPSVATIGTQSNYFVRVTMDPGLYTVAQRLKVKLYNQSAIDKMGQTVRSEAKELEQMEEQVRAVWENRAPADPYDESTNQIVQKYQTLENQKIYFRALAEKTLSKKQVIAACPSYGTASLLIVRNAFQSVFISILYTIFVLASVYHGFNGLWTFMITWGIVLKMRAQSRAVNVCVGLMVLIGFFGLASIWGTYFINLRH